MNEVYAKISSFKSYDELVVFLDLLKKESLDLSKDYDSKIKEYNRVKDTLNKTELNALIREINALSRRIDSYNKIINICYKNRVNEYDYTNSKEII